MRLATALLGCLLALVLPGFARADQASSTGRTALAPAEPAFRVKPSDVGGSAPGRIRRVIQPFGGWTLVCDEDLKARRKVCNVSQVIVDRADQTAFSWSLAGTERGAPVMILRAPNGPGDGRTALLRFRESESMIEVPLTECDRSQCLGYLEVEGAVAAKLRKGVPAEVTLIREGRRRDFELQTDGLAAALASLK